MREISVNTVKEKIKELILEASYVIGEDIYESLCDYKRKEISPVGVSVLDQLIRNYDIAKEERIAVCQDTGMAVVFIEVGQEVMLTGGNITEWVNLGVREAYDEGYLRKSVVTEPIFNRKNTGDNTPAIIHYSIVDGDKIDINVMPKGFGSENMSATKMLVPADGIEGVKQFVLQTVKNAGPNPCPPIIVGVGVGGTIEKATLMSKKIVGVGVGGTIEKATLMSKKVLLRKVGEHNENPEYANLEKELLKEVNKLGIGPAGTGGRTTALSVNIDYYPTHIASLPVAVNLCCHAARHAHATI